MAPATTSLPPRGPHHFAPRNELEIDLLRYLAARFGHSATSESFPARLVTSTISFATHIGEEPAGSRELAHGDAAATFARRDQRPRGLR